MYIYETRANHEPAGIDDLGRFLLGRGQGFDEFTVGNEDVTDFIPLGSGVDDATVFNDEKAHGRVATKSTKGAKIKLII